MTSYQYRNFGRYLVGGSSKSSLDWPMANGTRKSSPQRKPDLNMVATGRKECSVLKRRQVPFMYAMYYVGHYSTLCYRNQELKDPSLRGISHGSARKRWARSTVDTPYTTANDGIRARQFKRAELRSDSRTFPFFGGRWAEDKAGSRDGTRHVYGVRRPGKVDFPHRWST